MKIELKAASHGPVYAQVREQIERLINAGTLSSGETIPAPATLAQQLAVDRGEIQRAYFELEQSGLLKKESGKDFLGHSKVVYRVV
jgi:DNA-binding transcriptional regulator YhcF (GntR family)